MNTIAYKRNTAEVIERLCALYGRNARDRIFAGFEIQGKTLAEFRAAHSEGFCEYPDPRERIAFWDSLLHEHLTVDDDTVPSAYLSEFDQGLYGGLVGGDVQYMCHDNGWISSMVPPLLRDWSEFDSLKLDHNHPWFQRYNHQMNVYIEGSRDKFGISHFILIDGLNFVFELLGATNAYMSLFENPGMVRRAIDFAFDLNVLVQRTFFDTVPSFRGGTFSNMVQWIPGRIVSESVDPFHMTSVEYFETWGRANIERMFSEFDGGTLHIHGNGRHLFEAVCTLPGLKAILLGDDTGYPLAFDVLPELRRRTGDMPLIVTVPFGAFMEGLENHRLSGGVFYQVTGAPDIDAANRCMDRVRAYRE
ncbi:hypothetical protein LLG96_00465 [bacterium]|nr:hypothetical protein [bacterium]